MKQRTHLLLLLVASVLVIQQLPAEESAQIVNLRYYDHGGSSRLAVRVLGNPQYSTVMNEGNVRIFLPNTDVPMAYDGARMHFSSGFVTRVYIDRGKGDSTVITVGLKTNTAFRIERMDKAEGFYLDVFVDSSRTSAQDTARSDTTFANGHLSVIVPIQTMSFNSLVAAGSLLPQGRKDTIVPASTPAVVDPLPITSLLWQQTNLLHISLAVALAVLGTVVVLLFIRRVYARRPKRVPAAFTARFNEAIADHGYEQWEVPREMPMPRSVDTPPDHLVDVDSSALMLARRYGRGLGEVKLSFDLRSRQSERRWITKVREIAERNERPEDTIVVAKELGIGRGEVDLAVLLHHLKTPKTMKEELV